jgi:hypothetical protein
LRVAAEKYSCSTCVEITALPVCQPDFNNARACAYFAGASLSSV